MEKKYIHYCWFGDKPLPKLAQKCIKSWKKYLPDYEIMKWSEKNVDLNECAFIKEAYESKKWAFVADYARAKALKQYGGIYFDTDMEVIKNIDHLFKGKTYLGIEDTGYVAVGVWYEKNKDALLPSELLKKYQSMNGFNLEKMSSFAIPILISDILDDCGLQKANDKIQVLDNEIYIYPREYFYPYSYNRDNNLFTDNTVMIHYYDATWLPLKERIENGMIRKVGRNRTFRILEGYRKSKDIIRKIARVILFPVVIYREKKRKNLLVTKEYLERLENTLKEIENHKNEDYIVLHNSKWLGVTSATRELFQNTIDCGELYRKKDAKKLADTIIAANIKQVIFSSFTSGEKELVKLIKKEKKSIKIKTYWHGSHSQVHDYYGWERNTEIIELHKKRYIDVMGSCKESLQKFYKINGYNTKFITNKVTTSVKPERQEKKSEIRVGLYAAKCDDWRKNMFTQMTAVSLLDNAVLDIIPFNETAKEFGELLGIKMDGINNNLPREELISRMSKNDVNLYVTFSECAPMLPLESLEMKVPCITGNNHHYFKNNELEKYIVVKNENNANEIKEKIESCIKNKEKINKVYDRFREDNLKQSKKDIKDFLKM